jgi:hypothetical protein
MAFISAFSVQVPQGLADGTYIVSINNQGQETWTNITATITTSALAHEKQDFHVVAPRLQKHFFPWPSGTNPQCSKGSWFLQNDFYNYAWNSFYNACWDAGKHKFPRGTSLVRVQGTAMAYMCAFTTNPCDVKEWGDAVDWTSKNCVGRNGGWMEAGMFANQLCIMIDV